MEGKRYAGEAQNGQGKEKKKGRGKPEIYTYHLVSRDRKEMMHTLMHEEPQIANRKKEEPAKIDGSREAEWKNHNHEGKDAVDPHHATAV
jgi:hypothetical protein